MLEIILFVIAVFAWDGFKKSLRSPKKPTVTMAPPNVILAECGCAISPDGGRVKTACAAHAALLEMQG